MISACSTCEKFVSETTGWCCSECWRSYGKRHSWHCRELDLDHYKKHWENESPASWAAQRTFIFILGCMKGGTTTLGNLLGQLRQVNAPACEAHVFEDLDDPLVALRHMCMGEKYDARFVVDRSPSYIYINGALDRIQYWLHVNPKAATHSSASDTAPCKDDNEGEHATNRRENCATNNSMCDEGPSGTFGIVHPVSPAMKQCGNAMGIILLRNPIDRLWSQRNHFRQNDKTPALGAQFWKYESGPRSRDDVFRRGLYDEQVLDAIACFGRDKLLIIISERFRNNNHAVLRDVVAFAKIDKYIAPEEWGNLDYRDRHVREYDEVMSAEDREDLRQRYRPSVQRLREILQDDIQEWDDDFPAYKPTGVHNNK